jgi:TraM recognition site of TraD and TraG
MDDRWHRPDLFLGYLQGVEAPADKQQRLSLSDADCKTGLHVIGAPNTGKSKFLEHLIRQDIRRGHGLVLIDPHAELYEDILEWCAVVRPKRTVIPLNLSTGRHVVGFNPFIRGSGDIAAQADRCLSAAVKAWGADGTDQSPRLERVMRALFHAIIEAEDLTLCEADYFTTHANARQRDYLVERIGNPSVRGTWRDISRLRRFEDFANQVDSTRNRLSRFNDATVTRRFLALNDPAVNLDFRRAMDEGAVILVNIHPSEDLTEQNMRLLGSFLVSSFIHHGFRRDPKTARPFTLYLDEFYNFVPPDLGQALPQLRKFNVRFVLAHQLLSQLRKEDAHILDEILGCVKARVVFGGLQHADALMLAPEMFAGQTDYAEPKYWHETVKFWPVYDRERVRARGRAHTDMRTDGVTEMESETVMASHTDARGSSSNWGNSRSQQHSSGFSVPYLAGYPGGDGTRFDSTGWGLVTVSGGATSDVAADTTGEATTRGTARTTSTGTADTVNEMEADVPIYRPVAFVERTPEFHTLEEQRDRQATLLMLQYQRHCFVCSPGGVTRPVLVPFVERLKLPPELVRQYEGDMAHKAGALPPETVDLSIGERRRLIEQQAASFDRSENADVHSSEPLACEPPGPYESISLKPRSSSSPFSKPGRKPRSKRTLPTESS